MQIGSVVRLVDGTVRPVKLKRWIFVSHQGLFLRINSKRHFRPCCLIYKRDEPECLEWDSYVELRGVIDYDLETLHSDMADGEAAVLGRLSVNSIRLILAEVQASDTLNDDEIDAIVEGIRSS